MRIEDFYCASVALPKLNINDADTYQFVMGNPVARVDAGGTRLTFAQAQALLPPGWSERDIPHRPIGGS